ncbi:S-adenosyl-L-methionine-dependent methyltransferase [Xylaria digitata]|nr:S-adenosyl-L-methionine-dependent methyltransferase [Xylaria digitata]
MVARTLEGLSEIVASRSERLSSGLKTKGLTSPTLYDVENNVNFEKIDKDAAIELVDAARELEALVMGPSKWVNIIGLIYHDASSLGTLIEFDIPARVPLKGTITIAQLAAESGLLEDKLTRFIRYASTNYIFREPSPGVVAHTATSALLARDTQFSTFLQWVLVNIASIETAIPSACRKWPLSEKTNECGLNAAFGTDDMFFPWVNADPERLRRFDRAMAGFSGEGGGEGGRHQLFDVEVYPWSKELGPNARVVDVGGGSGHVGKALALKYPGFKVTVQDQSDTVKAAEKKEGLPKNLDFQAHNFFSEQTLRGADAYFLRHILHDWPRAEAVSILRGLVPALKPGARVLVSEFLMPGAERGPSLLEDKIIRQMDLQMMGVYNAKERTAEDFAALFSEADGKLRFKAKYQMGGDQKSCIFEAIYDERN